MKRIVKRLFIIAGVMLMLIGCKSKSEINENNNSSDMINLENALNWSGQNKNDIDELSGKLEASIEIKGKFYGVPANGNVYFSIYNKDVISEVILYVKNDDLSFFECSDKFKELYGLPVTGQEPYVAINGGVVSWERFNNDNTIILLSKGENYDFYSISSKMKNEEKLDVAKMSIEEFAKETGYVLYLNNSFSNFRIERKGTENGYDKKYRLTFRFDGKFYIVDIYKNANNFELFPNMEPINETSNYKYYDDGVYRYIIWNEMSDIWNVQAGNVSEDELVKVMNAVHSLYEGAE